MAKWLWVLTSLVAFFSFTAVQAQETPAPTPEALDAAVNVPRVILDVGQLLPSYFGVEADAITINSWQEMSFTNSCMGVALPDETCLRDVVSPAYSVIFGTPLGNMEFHINGQSGAFRLASPIQLHEGELPVTIWQRTGGFAGICHRLFLADDHRYLLLNCRARADENGVLGEGVLSDSDFAPISDFLMSAHALRWIPDIGYGADQFMDTYVAYGYGTERPSAQAQSDFNDALAQLAQEIEQSSLPIPTERPVVGDSGIEGQVTIGPTCPVMRQDDPCPDKPYQATITITDTAGVVDEIFQTDVNGYFHVPLPPGIYNLHPESPNVMPYAQDQIVTVSPGEYTEVTVVYDSGIR